MKTIRSLLKASGLHLVTHARRVLLITLIGFVLTQSASPAVGWAAPAPRSGDSPGGNVRIQAWTLSGGGPSQWIFGNQNGVDPITGRVSPNLPGLALEDARLSANPEFAYDTALTVWINNNMFVAPGTVTVTANSLTAGPVLTSSLEVTVQYYAVSTSATLRTLVSLHNPTGGPITPTVYWASNVGSDQDTGVRGTSTGDTLFTVSDRWVVTSDDPVSSSLLDPVNTHVLFGPEAPPVQPVGVTLSVFSDTVGYNQGVGATYNLTIPAGATRRMLFFNQMNATNEAALTAAAAFDRAPTPDDDLLTGLSLTELAEVVNWRLPKYYLFLPVVLRQ